MQIVDLHCIVWPVAILGLPSRVLSQVVPINYPNLLSLVGLVPARWVAGKWKTHHPTPMECFMEYNGAEDLIVLRHAIARARANGFALKSRQE
jgi:hypothetical protein